MNNILKFLDKTEENNKLGKFLKFIYFLFFPITYLIEYLTYIYYWKKIIIKELLTNDNIVQFFDENEFGYDGKKIYKKDIIEKDHIFQSLTMEELTISIKKEFTVSIVNIISQNLLLDIENYINLSVNCDVVVTDTDNIKTYAVIIRYYRYFILINNLKYLWFWVIIPVIYLILRYFSIL